MPPLPRRSQPIRTDASREADGRKYRNGFIVQQQKKEIFFAPKMQPRLKIQGFTFCELFSFCESKNVKQIMAKTPPKRVNMAFP
jgi:hypothetical protein